MWGIVSIVFGIIEVIIGLRFLLLLSGASIESGFVTWIYNVSNPLKAITGLLEGVVFEPASLIALVVYCLIGGILLRIIARPLQA